MYLTLKQKRKFVFIDKLFFFFLFSFVYFFLWGGGGLIEGRALIRGGRFFIIILLICKICMLLNIAFIYTGYKNYVLYEVLCKHQLKDISHNLCTNPRHQLVYISPSVKQELHQQIIFL